MRAILALLAGMLGAAVLSVPAAGASKCLHVAGVTTWSVPHIVVNNERNETVNVTLKKIEYSPSWAANKSWTVGPKTSQKFDLWGSGTRYERISVTGNGWDEAVLLLPAYEAAECDKSYWAIRVKVFDKAQTIDGKTYNIEGGYRFK